MTVQAESAEAAMDKAQKLPDSNWEESWSPMEAEEND
jgi:hypothetical protein